MNNLPGSVVSSGSLTLGSMISGKSARALENTMPLAVTGGLFILANIFLGLGLTSVWGGYIFAFSLLGLFWPRHFLAVFMFCMAFASRDFAYTELRLGPVPLYITEWVLTILLVSAIPKLKRAVESYKAELLPLAVYYVIGFLFFASALPAWGLLAAVRDFAIVYYALFSLAVFVHVDSLEWIKRLLFAVLLGTLPNILGEIGNFLYDTLPYTKEQQNVSMRNAFYYLIAGGFFLPFIVKVEGRVNKWVATYFTVIGLVIMLYSYSKTSMAGFLVLALLFFAIRFKHLKPSVIAIPIVILVFGLILTPHGKAYSMSGLFISSLYSEDVRLFLHLSALRDFVEQPYGIGFGSPIFSENAFKMLTDPLYFHSIHNSYLTVMRRIGFEGFLIFIWIVGYAVSRGYYLHKNSTGETKNISLGLLLSFLSVLVYCVAHVVLEGPFFGSFFWIIVGLLLSLSKVYKSTQPSPNE